MIMPQEMEVWYLLPAIRKHLAQEFIAQGLKQKEAAELLGLTEAAISQYLKSKRGQEIKFKSQDLEEIQKTATKIVSDRKNSMQYIVELSAKLKKSNCLCAIHRSLDREVPTECRICKDA